MQNKFNLAICDGCKRDPGGYCQVYEYPWKVSFNRTGGPCPINPPKANKSTDGRVRVGQQKTRRKLR